MNIKARHLIQVIFVFDRDKLKEREIATKGGGNETERKREVTKRNRDRERAMIMHPAAFQPPPHPQLSGREQPLQKGGNIKRPKKM